jgi:hypothetical protein
MAAPVSPRPDAPVAPAKVSSDWTVQVADTIESVVGSVRSKTAAPLETIARALVYGIIVSTMGVATLVLSTIMSIRLLGYLLPIWAAYAILGGLFTVAGLFLWRKRRPPGAKTSK